MAEHARILCGSMELSGIQESDKDTVIQNFLSLLQCLRDYRVTLVKEKDFDAHEYTFGTFRELFYLSWNDAIRRDAFKGVSQNVYQMLGPSLMQSPNIGKEIISSDWAKIKGFKCDFGMKPIMPESDYVYCSYPDSWHQYRIEFYCSHQEEYEWEDGCDEFLPNKIWSDKLLEAEIKRHEGKSSPCSDRLKELDKEKLSVKLHNGIIGHNGQTIEAYIAEIGTKVCKANFYRHEKDLSNAEQKACGSRRKIFSMINRNGKRHYISLDFAHGMFEYIDSHGDHIGEYRLTGEKNSGCEPDHGFKSGYLKKLK